jgi:hypothetical protein
MEYIVVLVTSYSRGFPWQRPKVHWQAGAVAPFAGLPWIRSFEAHVAQPEPSARGEVCGVVSDLRALAHTARSSAREHNPLAPT